jgi:predicted DsbA family dithiol-disulfide isomerase
MDSDNCAQSPSIGIGAELLEYALRQEERCMRSLDIKPLEIRVTYDFICPWCWVAYTNLKDAVRRAGLEVVPVVKFIPYEINPTMPRAGCNRREYRIAKFGSWRRSQERETVSVFAGKRIGLNFNYDRIEVTPNTRLAHRLLFFVEMRRDMARTEDLYNAIFRAYFSDGRDIGKTGVLAEIAASVGIPASSVTSFLATDALDHEVEALELKAMATGVEAVPTIQIGRTRMNGARTATVLANVMKDTAAGPTFR